MCVIVYRPQGIELSINTLQDMWATNPDGAGYAYWENDRIVIRKGFMDLEKLVDSLNTAPDVDMVIHFRFATHGMTNPAQTHPFVVTRDSKASKAWSNPRNTYSSALFHNGIIHGYGTEIISDTIDFVSSVLAEIPLTKTRLDVLNLMHGKFALLQDGEIYRIGEFELYEGMEVSNLHWARFEPITTTNDGRIAALNSEDAWETYMEDEFWTDKDVKKFNSRIAKHLGGATKR